MSLEMERVKRIRNGTPVRRTFSDAEMTRRQDGLRRILGELDLHAAILTSYHNVAYYSDFLYTRFGRRYALVVTADMVTSVSANIDGGQPWRRTGAPLRICFSRSISKVISRLRLRGSGCGVPPSTLSEPDRNAHSTGR